jgi:Outer membrane lipoprotein-sorting protein
MLWPLACKWHVGWEAGVVDATETKVNGTAGNQRNSAGSQLFLLFAVLVPLASSFGQNTNHLDNSSVQLKVVVQSMEEAQSDIQLPRHLTREYWLGSPARLAVDSGVVAHLDFTPPGRYAIERRSGSNRAEQVVRQLLEHEIETAMSIQRSKSTAITTENYDFSFLRKEVLNGHPCYVLQIIPKRQQSELISGRAWIDQHSFLIRRIEGDLARSPSWWVKQVHVDLEFASSQNTWLQISMEAVAEVRCLGEQKLTSRVLDYDTAPLSANTAGFGRSAAASGGLENVQ